MQQAAESSVEGAGFEIRNSKYEIRNKLNDPNSELSSKRAFRVCCFGFSFNLKFVWLRFVSAFDIRIWIFARLVLDMRKRFVRECTQPMSEGYYGKNRRLVRSGAAGTSL